MPMADDTLSSGNKLARILIYGPDKSKKSWWAMKAAEDGYNVVLLDGDDGSAIVRQIKPEARKKILIADVVNTQNKAVFIRFMASFMRPGNAFMWDEQDKISINEKTKLNPTHSYIRFEPSKLTSNDVLIIDSWTALAASSLIEFANEKGINLTEVEKEGDQFALLNYQQRILDYSLNQIHTLPCHVVVIGHETVYEKFKTDSSGKRTMVSSELIPISSTGPQGKKLGKHFNDVLRFYKISDVAYRIDAAGGKDVAGGSRLLEPKIHDWNTITPQTLFANIGSKPTGQPCIGARWIASGSSITEIPVLKTGIEPEAPKTPAQPQVIDAGSGKSKMQMMLEQSRAKST